MEWSGGEEKRAVLMKYNLCVVTKVSHSLHELCADKHHNGFLQKPLLHLSGQ